MKSAKLILSILMITVTSGCATAHFTRPCYVSPTKKSEATQQRDYNECMMGAITPHQLSACMYLRNYNLAECDTMTGEFVRN